MVSPDSLASALEQTILQHRMIPIQAPWTDEIVYPYYDGLSIRNLAHTVVRLLESHRTQARLGSAPLDGRLWEHLWGRVRRVVLFVTDGLGWRLLNELIAADATIAQTVADLTGDGTLTPLTSVVPSTTAAALPSIWTGTGPGATGMVGTRVFLREFGTLASLLHYVPLVGKHAPESLEAWGLDFETFMPATTLGQYLSAHRIPTYVLLQKDLWGSGLSRIMHRGIKHTVRHHGYTDLWITLRDLLVQTHGEKCFISIYWGAVDGISHLHGTVTEQSCNEIRRQLDDLRTVLSADGVSDGRTLFMLCADHGHTPIPNYIDLNEHSPLLDGRRCGLGGEGRFAYAYLRHDFRPAFIDYVETHLGDSVGCLSPAEALAAGLFGPEDPHPETAARLGDLVLVSRDGVSVGEKPFNNLQPLSRHGALSDREMLVPLLLRPL